MKLYSTYIYVKQQLIYANLYVFVESAMDIHGNKSVMSYMHVHQLCLYSLGQTSFWRQHLCPRTIRHLTRLPSSILFTLHPESHWTSVSRDARICHIMKKNGKAACANAKLMEKFIIWHTFLNTIVHKNTEKGNQNEFVCQFRTDLVTNIGKFPGGIKTDHTTFLPFFDSNRQRKHPFFLTALHVKSLTQATVWQWKHKKNE